MGDGVSWGRGFIHIVPRLQFTQLAKELVRGRPVIFLPAENVGCALEKFNFDRDAPLSSLLNGNECLTVSGCRSGQPVFAHIGSASAGRSSVYLHGQGLSDARAALLETALLRNMAEPIEQFDRGNVSIFMQTLLGGRRVVPSDDRFFKLLDKTTNTVQQLHAATVDFGACPESELLSKMRSDLSLIEDKNVIRLTEGMIEEIEEWINLRKPPAVRVHGDFSMANLLFDENDNVTAIVDWEWTRAKGCAGFDAIHVAISAVAEHERNDFASVASKLIVGGGSPRILKYLDRTLPKLDMDGSDIPSLAKLYWLNLIFRGGVWTKPPNNRWWPKITESIFALKGAR